MHPRNFIFSLQCGRSSCNKN
nr:unnamed protein product [Callosobruchus chinensis]